jgi:hypothetical protein
MIPEPGALSFCLVMGAAGIVVRRLRAARH